MRDSLHEVGLAKARASVDEEGVVNSARRLCNRVRSCGSKFVGFTDNKVLEGVPFIQKWRYDALLLLLWCLHF